MKYVNYLFVSILWINSYNSLNAHTNPKLEGQNTNSNAQAATFRADCATAKSKTLLDINNVRATLLVGGDIWWDGNIGQYIIPNPPGGSGIPPVSSLFAGAVWIGGYDSGGSLKLAAQTYGTMDGNTDFWPGPLTEQGTIGEDTCAQWDRFFEVSGANIDRHLQLWQEALENNESDINLDLIPDDILGWPANGNPFFFEVNNFELPITDQGLAPFYDENRNTYYEPNLGDYPIIDIRGCEELDIAPQYGDQMIFWIYNDAGGVHSETGGIPIQMEIQVQAFAYETNDEINNMTFYRYKLINRALDQIDSCYFAMWVDPDLGCYLDDYVGCDTTRSLMYVYNADALDGESSCNDCNGVFTYCTDIPMIGVDYFRGPLGPKIFCNGVDASEGLCNPPRNTEPDTIVELGMSSFTYYNNGSVDPPPPPGTEDPSSPTEYYNYLSGSWRDGLRLTYGGNGHNMNSTDYTNYAFTEPPDDIDGWSMCSEGLADGDRRTVQASGPFRLDPGAVNELIIGAVWVPDFDYPCPSISKLTFADDIAQALFDNCFDITDGPDAPDVCFVELDKEIILTLSNESTSNNFEERYIERDLRSPTNLTDSIASYRFEGYKIYQLRTADVTSVEFDNPEKARPIYQVDLKNGITEIFNWFSVENPQPGGEDIWVPQSKVQGSDKGIHHTFTIKEDQFGLSSKNLINHKKYYFSVIAYGYNNYEDFDPIPPVSGQRAPYIEGRRNIGPKSGGNAYTVIPRPIINVSLNAEYGDGPVITRVDGAGVGHHFLDVSDEMREIIFEDKAEGKVTYLKGGGPIEVKVYNPLDIVDGNYELSFIDESGNGQVNENSRWVLKNLNDASSYNILSAETIKRLNEQTIAEYGFSVSIVQTAESGDLVDDANGAIGFDLTYKDVSGPEWVVPIPLAGSINFIDKLAASVDPALGLTNMCNGAFYPYRVCDYGEKIISPGWQSPNNGNVIVSNSLDKLNNIDIVLTSDKSKWSRCVVVETANSDYTDSTKLDLPTEGNVIEFKARKSASVGSDSNPDGQGSGTGMSWFPGYAVDVECGTRLNIFFGENSTYDCLVDSSGCEGNIYGPQGPTGRDMIWNPSSQVFVNSDIEGIYNWYAGGQHYIYVTDEEYDSCKLLYNLFESTNQLENAAGVKKIKWVGTILPYSEDPNYIVTLNSYEDGIIPNDVLMKIRVDNSYKNKIGTGENDGMNKYYFTFDGAQAGENDTQQEIDSQLDAINVVPNPYYAFSDYETSQFSNVIKITNLPAKCDVTIFTLDGTFIRQYKRNEERMDKGLNFAPLSRGQITPAIEWDLKNNKGVQVASGVYLIHIDADDLGERVIKWFGVARKFDPSGL